MAFNKVTLRIGDIPQFVILDVRLSRVVILDVGEEGYRNPGKFESVAHDELDCLISVVL